MNVYLRLTQVWEITLQVALGVVWIPLFIATVVHDLAVEWRVRRERAREPNRGPVVLKA